MPTSPDSDAGETNPDSTVQLSLSIDQLVAIALVFGLLIGALSTSLAFTSGLLHAGGSDVDQSATVAQNTPTEKAAQDGSQSITAQVSDVSTDTVADCMSSNRESFVSEINADRDAAGRAGISGTPSFLIYQTGDDRAKRVVGAHPYSLFESHIEAALAGNASGNISTGFETDGEQTWGADDAAVTILYWTDYQCPFCEEFDREVLPRLRENYVASGEVRIVMKDFAFLGDDSRTAALASRCVWTNYDQQTWTRWHSTVFENQGSENSGWASEENLVG